MSVNRCACALLVTPYKLRIINNWPTVPLEWGDKSPHSK